MNPNSAALMVQWNKGLHVADRTRETILWRIITGCLQSTGSVVSVQLQELQVRVGGRGFKVEYWFMWTIS